VFPHFESAIGKIDGANSTFRATLPYQAGTLAVYLNGLLLLTGYVEVPPRSFTLSVPPSQGDEVLVFFLSAAPAPPEEVIQLQGVIDPLDEVRGAFLEVQALHGTLTTEDP
jgi:hypothetical protein